MADSDVDLTPFCASERFGGANMTRPFSRGEWTYATDGKVAARVPRRSDVPEYDDAPHIERVWPKEAALIFMPVVQTTLPDPEYAQCDICDGRGTQHDCPDCQCRCDQCDGEGRLETTASVAAGSALITRRVAELLMKLPEAEVAPVSVMIMQFRFRGGEGICTILQPRADRQVIGRITADEDNGG